MATKIRLQRRGHKDYAFYPIVIVGDVIGHVHLNSGRTQAFYVAAVAFVGKIFGDALSHG